MIIINLIKGIYNLHMNCSNSYIYRISFVILFHDKKNKINLNLIKYKIILQMKFCIYMNLSNSYANYIYLLLN